MFPNRWKAKQFLQGPANPKVLLQQNLVDTASLGGLNKQLGALLVGE
jgi:hypothetical protein